MIKKYFNSLFITMMCILIFFSTNFKEVNAMTNADTLYAKAFASVNNCKETNGQQEINEARNAINQLKGTSASWAIGEFSKQTDIVQQKLFEEFMGLLFDEKNEPKDKITQESINRAKELVISFDTYIGNKPYTSSWSSAVDKYQQNLMEEALGIIYNIEITPSKVGIENAKMLINSLLTAKNNLGVMEFAKNLMEKIINIENKYEQGLLEDAMKLVTNAEISKSLQDIEKAKIAITKLINESTTKEILEFSNGLIKRIEKINNNAKQLLMDEAETLVINAEISNRAVDIDKARKALNKILEEYTDEVAIDFYNKSMTRLNAIVVKEKEITLIGARPGHNENCVGANSILEEVTEDRKIFEKTFEYLNPYTKVIDCTPYHNPSQQIEDLRYGVDKANSNNVDFYFSIHLNKAYETIQERAMGCEVWVYDENSILAIDKAKAVLSNLEKLGFKNRGIKYSKNLFELDNTNSEAMIIECFFLESKVDCDLYQKIGYDKIGQAIASGINNKVPFTTPTTEESVVIK